jgi:serine phosphatase RsbU (regulator of sigma subunit)
VNDAAESPLPAPNSIDAAARLKQLLAQLGKLSRITQLVSEGHFFLYHPNAESSGPDDPINLLAENFNFMIKKLRDSHQELENKVVERTLQLEAKTEQLEKLYKDVLEIKARQDCDFYLTSLLVEPLGANRARDTGVIIDFLVDQKKKFHFRGQLKSIGGDICGADTIVLQGETYTAFLNADAMGKSIQGAAGALIVGSIFDAILKRSKLQQTETNKYPEAWLKEAFIELQKVFESFKGGMMISLILGLICNRTGTLYHINAEYPCPVLLRRGTAQFITSTPFMRVGIGPEFLSGPGYRPLRVEVMQLEHADILLSGSDGRDDILMEIAGDVQMNRDDSQFLQIVQTHGGDLEAVFAALQELGNLSDDISLMRARVDLPHRVPPKLGMEGRALVRRYRKQSNPAERRLLLRKLVDSGIKAGWLKKRLAIEACRERQYEPALAYAEEYCHDYPVDDAMLFLSAQLNAKIGNIDAAAALADRLLNRNPESSAYLSLRKRASKPASERPR